MIKSLVNVSGGLADEPTDKITQVKPTRGTVQYHFPPATSGKIIGYMQ